MTQANPLSSRIMAALSALVLSVMLFSGTVTTPASAQAQGVTSYVGVVA